MVEVSIGELLLAFVAAMGIPSAIMGLIVWRFKGHIEAREEAQAEKAKAQHAMQRGHTNGDMETALAYATDIKHKQKDFLAKQGIHALLDE